MITKSIEKNGKIFMLAYDQGMEHGPRDFNELNYHPNFILKTAINGGASCVAMQYGIAKQFYTREIKKKIPLILKLNGKTSLYSKNTRYALLASVADAISLGAVGIGFTINPGQVGEHMAFEQFAIIRKEAEKAGLITGLWSYARGPEVKDQFAPEIVGYAIRIAAELGADFVKVKYTGDAESFASVAKMSLNTKVLVSGTDNFKGNYLKEIEKLMKLGIGGVAVGRNVWQNENPEKISLALAKRIYGNQ